VVDTLVAGFGMVDRIAVEVKVTPAPLRAEDALALGLLLNEWVTNSLKHAYPGLRGGTIRIALTVAEDEVQLDYADDGVGVEGLRSRPGIGTGIVAGLVRQLEGRLEQVPVVLGMAYRLRFPARA
jgi:two-component sensor histidine kinase